jgi:hypothetical protein
VGLELLEEPPHVIGVVLVDQGEGDRSVPQRVGCKQQGEAAEVQLIDAVGAAGALQGPLPVVGHIERLGPFAEAVADESVG